TRTRLRRPRRLPTPPRLPPTPPRLPPTPPRLPPTPPRLPRRRRNPPRTPRRPPRTPPRGIRETPSNGSRPAQADQNDSRPCPNAAHARGGEGGRGTNVVPGLPQAGERRTGPCGSA